MNKKKKNADSLAEAYAMNDSLENPDSSEPTSPPSPHHTPLPIHFCHY